MLYPDPLCIPPSCSVLYLKHTRREKLSVIDIVCVTNICATHSCSLFTSHYIVLLVTTTEWLSPWYNDCCYDRRREKKKFSWGFPDGWEKVINLELEEELCCAAPASVLFIRLSQGLMCLVFVADEQKEHKTLGAVNVAVVTGQGAVE